MRVPPLQYFWTLCKSGWLLMRLSRSGIKNMVGKKASSGFSLIELLIVVAIILIIAAIAIPNFLRARMAANEAAAASNLRAITTASVTYSTTYGNGYPPSLAALGTASSGIASCDAADLVDPNLTATPYQKSGYVFGYTGSNPTAQAAGCGSPGFNAYLVTATPVTTGMTGTRSFCSDEPAEIFYDITGATTASETACEALPPLQ
jgi:type IV pilus assembly protein PilA